ncbi:cysteine-rich venom protein-like [Castor canadensis]|uniref:Cysteine-rich venom protein-like n=1 Tax=Castor canadensis TaxID=51338 RepID=A0AC58N813_CASCN
MVLVGICFLVLLQQSAGMMNISLISLLTHHPSTQMEIINKHNDLRRMTNPSASNMLKMTWNANVAKNAENWAKKCTLSHSPHNQRKISFAGCGENLFMSSRPESWSDAIQFLYNEVKDFKYGIGNTRANANTFHYTQLVWATSHQLGCALAHCPHQKLPYYYVCQYCPAGNNVRTWKTPYRKGKPCGDCPGHCDNRLCTNPCMYEDKYTNCADLVKFHGCNLKLTRENCQATCKCPSEIK